MSETEPARDWIAHKGKAAKLGLTLRSAILKTLPDLRETLDQKAEMVAYGVGYGHEDLVVVMRSVGPTWSLGFYRGRELDDPTGMLGGGGRMHATAMIAGREDVESKALKDLLVAAYEAALRRKANEGSGEPS